ncbi:Rieske (2Fe-2S) protein [Atopomonas sediminilitoris]|uniref:Rieske (2Fe-2S) protein n=1 Tax=Atopomonas sediminilitoris TaxID=2919919 RepID=UPI001F4E6D04|nr:Rieske 2Fe-2S domain-containing protein [Atopomonas sediminilitoris]MCJ8168115.1 Rieske 2Fe-2S domain-containing protein [Atopomonas sediminilitoris]
MIFLCPANALAEGQSKSFIINQGSTQGSTEQTLIGVRRHGQVYVYINRCPHRGIGLEWLPDQFLDASGTLLQCATHGALFLIETGECVAGPCSGQHLSALSCHEDADGIWLD